MVNHRIETLEAMREREMDILLEERIKAEKSCGSYGDNSNVFDLSVLKKAQKNISELEVAILEKRKQNEGKTEFCKIEKKLYKMPFDSVHNLSGRSTLCLLNIVTESKTLNRRYTFKISRRWGESKLRYSISTYYLDFFSSNKNIRNEKEIYSGDKKGFIFYLDIIKDEILKVKEEKTEDFSMTSAGYLREVINNEIKIPHDVLQAIDLKERDTVQVFFNDNAICIKRYGI